MQERLKNQKAEAASNPEYGKSYKPQVSKADKQAKRKQILSNIGDCACITLLHNAVASHEMGQLRTGKAA